MLSGDPKHLLLLLIGCVATLIDHPHSQLAERALSNGGNWRLLEAVAASLHPELYSEKTGPSNSNSNCNSTGNSNGNSNGNSSNTAATANSSFALVSSSTAADFIAALLAADMAYLNALLVALVGLLLVGLPETGSGLTQVR